MDAVEVMLPRGMVVDEYWHRTAWLRPLSGQDQAFVSDAGRALLPVQRTTALLARCLQGLGPLAPVPTAVIQTLTIGDREALLLHLRRLTLGEQMACVLSCADQACGEKMDLDLQVRDLLEPPYPAPQVWYETLIADCCVRFRLPTGADQEAAAMLPDPDMGAVLLLQRCLGSVRTVSGDAVNVLPPAVTAELPALMAQLDPQAELRLRLTCPACEGEFSTCLDAATYFFQELDGRMGHLYREVHLLAFYYHWSEADILAMTRQKRWRYLHLLAEALSTGRDR